MVLVPGFSSWCLFLVSLSMVSKRRLLHTGNAILATDVAYSSAWGLLSDTIFCPWPLHWSTVHVQKSGHKAKDPGNTKRLGWSEVVCSANKTLPHELVSAIQAREGFDPQDKVWQALFWIMEYNSGLLFRSLYFVSLVSLFLHLGMSAAQLPIFI